MLAGYLTATSLNSATVRPIFIILCCVVPSKKRCGFSFISKILKINSFYILFNFVAEHFETLSYPDASNRKTSSSESYRCLAVTATQPFMFFEFLTSEMSEFTQENQPFTDL